MITKTMLGWAQSRTTEHSVVCHAVVSWREPRPGATPDTILLAAAACRRTLPLAGTVHAEPPDYAPHPCRRCAQIAPTLPREERTT